MDFNVKISDLTIGQHFEGFYILKEAQSKTTAAGKPFLSAVLSDCSGKLPAMVWDYAGPIVGTDAGKVVKVRGEVSEYKGSLQITVDKIRLAGAEDHYDVAALVPVAPIDVDAVLRGVRDLLSSIEDEDYRQIASTLLNRNLEAFKSIPAAKSVHHAFLHGLLMHTAYMLRIAEFFSKLYPGVMNRSLLLTGTLLHDFKKREEFTFSELGLVTDYSVKGQLLGHLVMGAQEIAAVAAELGIPEEKSVLLQHMVLSHHGEPEFGAAVRPMCAEAELLSYIDMIDSRMEIYKENFESTPLDAFSERIFALDGKRIFHHN